MPWQQITVTTTEQQAPALAEFFDDLGAVSVTLMDAYDEPVYEPALGETKIWSSTQVIALFELPTDPTVIKAQVETQFAGIVWQAWHQEEIADQAWERAWMEYYQPMKFADRLWVCPTGQAQSEAGTVCLTLDPGLAFGTGTHPTTALCLEWLASQDLAGATVIDYGCGSGILAVAAVLLGAEHAYAVDIDPQALTATQDNATKNQVQDKISCHFPAQLPAIQADVLMANILAKPLVDLAETLLALVPSQGHIVLSGILTEQAEAVIAAYSQRVQFAPPVFKEDWLRLVGQRR